jgi:hypothetical protein
MTTTRDLAAEVLTFLEHWRYRQVSCPYCLSPTHTRDCKLVDVMNMLRDMSVGTTEGK